MVDRKPPRIKQEEDEGRWSSAHQEEILRELADTEHVHVTPERKSFFEKVKEYFADDES